MNYNKIVADLLEEFASKLRVGTSTLSPDEALALVSNIAHINLSKQDVADRYGVSTKTIERKEQNNEIPRSHPVSTSKKQWWLDELIVFEHENNIQ